MLARNITKRVILADRLVWAGSGETRRRGLLDRTHLDAGEGMYITPTQWIHMFGMKFAIDVAFLSREGRVLVVHHGLKPKRLSRIVFRADGALELPEGTLTRTNTGVGDVVVFEGE